PESWLLERTSPTSERAAKSTVSGMGSALQLDDGLAHAHRRAGGELDGLGEALVADEGAVRRAEVLDPPGAVLGEEAGVAGGGVGEHERGRRRAADDDRGRAERQRAAGERALGDDEARGGAARGAGLRGARLAAAAGAAADPPGDLGAEDVAPQHPEGAEHE